MTITEARKIGMGTVGLTSASQVINGTPARVVIANPSTSVRPRLQRQVARVQLRPAFVPTERIELTPRRSTRRRRKAGRKKKQER